MSTSRYFIKLIFNSLVAVALGAGVARGNQDIEFSIEETLKSAAFNTQHMPTQAAFVSKYGEGNVYRRPGRVYRVYYLANLKLWMRCRGDAEDRRYVPISEIMISKMDLGTKTTPCVPVIDPNLKGIRIGDKIQLARAQWGEPLRQYKEKLGSFTTKVYEFFPASLGSGLCLRYFTRDDDEEIVAFSFSSEE